MAEPLTVDSARLKAAGTKLADIALPVAPPAVDIAEGTDSVSKAVTELMPLMEAPITESLSGVNAALSQTGTSIAIAADRYAETDQLLGENFGNDTVAFADVVGGRSATDRLGAKHAHLQSNPIGSVGSAHSTERMILGQDRSNSTHSALLASDSGSDAVAGVAAEGIRPIGFIAGSMYATTTAVTAAQDLLQGVQTTAQGVQSFVSSVSSDAGQQPAQLVSDTTADDDQDDAPADSAAADSAAAGAETVDGERAPIGPGTADGGSKSADERDAQLLA